MLVAAGMVNERQVQEALNRQKQTGKRLGELLVEMGYVTEVQVTQILSNQLSIPWVNLSHVDFSRELLDLVPAQVAERYCLVPVYVRQVRRQGQTLFVAMEDPTSMEAMQAAADCSGLPVKPMVAAPTDIRNAIRVYYLGLPPAARADSEPAEPIDLDQVIEEAESARDTIAPEPAAPVQPSTPPAADRKKKARFLTLTLLDGTQVRLPGKGKKKAEPKTADGGLTTRDLINALRARAAGENVTAVLPDDRWEPLFAALLSLLMRKGLIADWELVSELNAQTAKKEE
jgi:type IV pilus assembly protein PilB